MLDDIAICLRSHQLIYISYGVYLRFLLVLVLAVVISNLIQGGRVQISVGNISSWFEVTSGTRQQGNLSQAYVYITQQRYWVCYSTLQLFTFHGRPYKLYSEI